MGEPSPVARARLRFGGGLPALLSGLVATGFGLGAGALGLLLVPAGLAISVAALRGRRWTHVPRVWLDAVATALVLAYVGSDIATRIWGTVYRESTAEVRFTPRSGLQQTPVGWWSDPAEDEFCLIFERNPKAFRCYTSAQLWQRLHARAGAKLQARYRILCRFDRPIYLELVSLDGIRTHLGDDSGAEPWYQITVSGELDDRALARVFRCPLW